MLPTHFAWKLLSDDLGGLTWNLILAFVPLWLSLELFQTDRSPRIGRLVWWLGFATFITFLPNAPYVLNDIGDVARLLQAADADKVWISSLILIPKYAISIALGLTAYGLSLLNLERYLKQQGWPLQRRRTLEFALHALCAIGIYVGRFLRFNSWDIVVRPDTLLWASTSELSQIEALRLICLTFAILIVLYRWGKPTLRILATQWIWQRHLDKAPPLDAWDLQAVQWEAEAAEWDNDRSGDPKPW